MGHSEREQRYVGTGTFRATDRTRALVNQVLDTGQVSYGTLSKAFERQVATLHGCRYGVLANSGTSALQVALQALKEERGWADGDEVLVPAQTFVATANIVLHNRMRPVLVDVDRWFGMDPDLVAQALDAGRSRRTRAMIPVHLFGQAADMLALGELAETYDLAVVEDACEAMFASQHGRPVGSMGDVGCFSTYNAHIVATGVGGMATTGDPDLAKRMRCLVNHGLHPDELNLDDNFSPRPMLGRDFRFAYAGHSYRITELEAALGLAQLEERERILAGRRRNARHLYARLKMVNEYQGAGLELPEVRPGNEHSWMMFPVLVAEESQKPALTAWLNDRQVETRDLLPLTNQPVYQSWVREEDHPRAMAANRRGFYVGVHQDLGPEDMDYVGDCFEAFYKRQAEGQRRPMAVERWD